MTDVTSLPKRTVAHDNNPVWTGLDQGRVEDAVCWRIAAGPVHRGREATGATQAGKEKSRPVTGTSCPGIFTG